LIPFTKAHACGNDFLIVTEDAAQNFDWPELTRRLCARNTGIGADGIEFFAWTGPKSGRLRLHNADGSIAEISGNGTRCVAAWMALERGCKPGDELEIVTDAGLRICHVNAMSTTGGNTVEMTAGMGIPAFAPRTVALEGGLKITGIDVSTGNPHFVIVVDNAEFAVAGQSWTAIGARICVHPDFRPTSSSCASSAPPRSRFASSSAAWAQPPLPAQAVPPRPRRLSHSTIAFRRSPWQPPAARRQSHGTGRARSSGSPVPRL
jgi:diaminopimelate epimerase